MIIKDQINQLPPLSLRLAMELVLYELLRLLCLKLLLRHSSLRTNMILIIAINLVPL